MTEELFQAIVGGVVLGVLITILSFIFRGAKIAKEKITDNKEQIINTASNAAKKMGDVAANAYQSSSEIVKKLSDRDSDIDEKYFEAAYKELHSDEIRRSLWVKELALANQDEAKAEAGYIKVRAREIRNSKQ